MTDAVARLPLARRTRLRPVRVAASALLVAGLLADPGLTAVRGGEAGGVPGIPDRPTTEATVGSQASAIHHGRWPAADGVGGGVDGAAAAPLAPNADPIAVADGNEPPATTEPSIVALDAAAHADDRIAFTPGARVSVPFQPRAGDGWPVDGLPPRALPAGAASGRSMASETQGSVWAPSSAARPAAPSESGPGGPRPVDAPGGAPAIAAQPVVAVAPATQAGEPAAATGLRREVFGFLPYWELARRLDPARLRRCSRRSPTSASAPTPTATSRSATPTARRRSAGRGWTSSKMTSVIQAAHANGTPGRPDRPELRLDLRPGGDPEGAARQPDRAAQPRPPDRGRRPRPRRRRRQPRLRADRRRATPTSSSRSSEPIRAELDAVAPGLPADVRHDRLRSATTRSRRPPRPAARTRSSSWATTTGRPRPRRPARSPRSAAPAYDLADTLAAVPRAASRRRR